MRNKVYKLNVKFISFQALSLIKETGKNDLYLYNKNLLFADPNRILF